MAKKLIGFCPVCNEKLKISEFKCDKCGTSIHGDFELSKFDYLTSQQQEFVLIFLKNEGNIKLIEKELGISYPTVKKNLYEIVDALGFSKYNYEVVDSKEEILKQLKEGKISFEEAESLLKDGGFNE